MPDKGYLCSLPPSKPLKHCYEQGLSGYIQLTVRKKYIYKEVNVLWFTVCKKIKLITTSVYPSGDHVS